jgi:2-hydroxychromene-2-carboxylate isomerase
MQSCNVPKLEIRRNAGNTGGAFGIPTFIPGEPRFYGVEVTAKF